MPHLVSELYSSSQVYMFLLRWYTFQPNLPPDLVLTDDNPPDWVLTDDSLYDWVQSDDSLHDWVQSDDRLHDWAQSDDTSSFTVLMDSCGQLWTVVICYAFMCLHSNVSSPHIAIYIDSAEVLRLKRCPKLPISRTYNRRL